MNIFPCLLFSSNHPHPCPSSPKRTVLGHCHHPRSSSSSLQFILANVGECFLNIIILVVCAQRIMGGLDWRVVVAESGTTRAAGTYGNRCIVEHDGGGRDDRFGRYGINVHDGGKIGFCKELCFIINCNSFVQLMWTIFMLMRLDNGGE